MKSIKEKIRSDYPKSDILEEELSRVGYRVGFENGANYVLDAIEECFNPKDDIVTQWGAITTLVEQLKSNQ